MKRRALRQVAHVDFCRNLTVFVDLFALGVDLGAGFVMERAPC
jgi:hypothetical protein